MPCSVGCRGGSSLHLLGNVAILDRSNSCPMRQHGYETGESGAKAISVGVPVPLGDAIARLL